MEAGEIERLAEEKIAGKSYSRIRAELSQAGMPDEEIHHLIRQVDELVLEKNSQAGKAGKAKAWYWGGLALAISGLLLTLLHNAGLVLADRPPWLVYTVFFAGLALMLYGRHLKRLTTQKSESGPGAIRKKRPYK